MEIINGRSWTRRRVALAAGGIPTTLLALIQSAEVDAKKKHHKKKKKKQTCDQLCGGVSQYCFERADAPTLCTAGTVAGSDCQQCDSDQDCLSHPGAYCLTRYTDLETGITASFAYMCGQYPVGVCISAIG